MQLLKKPLGLNIQRLLEAAVLEPSLALPSWRAFLAENDLETIDSHQTVLLPFVYRNLKEKSHPLCKSIYRYTWTFNQSFWSKTLPVLNQFIAAGIEKVVLLKGMALILHHYKDFGVRTIGDIDVLIERKEVPLAYSLLLAGGWDCTLRRLDPHNPSQLFRWNSANFTHPSGLNLDLHWSLILESTPEIDQAVFKAVAPGIQPADPTHLLLQTCVHGCKLSTAPLIRWIPDALQLLKSPINFPHLFALAKGANLTLPLMTALNHLSSRFSASIPPFTLKPSLLERLEFRANLRGSIYLAGYYRARMRGVPLIRYLQSTANLSSPWIVPLYAFYWLLKRIYRWRKNEIAK